MTLGEDKMKTIYEATLKDKKDFDNSCVDRDAIVNKIKGLALAELEIFQHLKFYEGFILVIKHYNSEDEKKGLKILDAFLSEGLHKCYDIVTRIE
jgi:hypothetical protein